jgi:hypothetical protein
MARSRASLMVETIVTNDDNGNISQLAEECCSFCSNAIYKEM